MVSSRLRAYCLDHKRGWHQVDKGTHFLVWRSWSRPSYSLSFRKCWIMILRSACQVGAFFPGLRLQLSWTSLAKRALTHDYFKGFKPWRQLVPPFPAHLHAFILHGIHSASHFSLDDHHSLYVTWILQIMFSFRAGSRSGNMAFLLRMIGDMYKIQNSKKKKVSLYDLLNTSSNVARAEVPEHR